MAVGFTDPDGDSLAFAALSSDTTVVRVVAVAGGGVELESVDAGEAEITVTATDPDGLLATTVFRVLVELDPRVILAALYEATDGPNWTNSLNWLTDAPLEDWHGVDTDASGRVTRLYFRGNGLAGPIPSELGSLSSLRRLHLDRKRTHWNDPVGN